MPVILVVEQDANNAERIRDVLLSSGFNVDTVGSLAEALSRAQTRAPSLLIARSDASEAADLFAAFSRRSGGPGSIAIVGADAAAAEDSPADETLAEPFSDDDLLQRVRHCLDAAPRRQAATPSPSLGSEQLTSADIFGDVLAEVEAEAGRDEPTAETAGPMEDIERRLEETLSGVIPTTNRVARPRDLQPEPPSDPAIDDLLDQTLSSLDIPTRAKKPKAAGQPAPEPPAPETNPAAELAPPEPAVDPAAAVGTALPSGVPAEIAEATPSAKADVPAQLETESVPPAFDIEIPPELEAAETTLAVDSDSLGTSGVESETADLETDPERPSPLAESALAEPPPGVEPDGESPMSEPDKDLLERSGAGFLETDPAIHPQEFQPQPDQFRTTVMPSLATAQETEPGEDFGEYTLLDRIAVGGMAEVWRARRRGVEGFQKTVAIKKILSHLTGSADFVSMFIDEAKLAAQLNHNNIIQIYDLGKVEHDFFIAMEYVDGKDLRSILTAAEAQDQPLPPGLGLFIISAVARALDYAHRKRDFEDRALGLVHRDVSPQNVLISYEGEIKLCDFGIVKAVAKASTTQMGALKGKLQYMSPEQAWGKSVDARSDIFSLGSVMYELLTGTKLFAGESEIGILDAVRECRVPSLRKSVPDLPEDVERIALKALAKSADERYQTAGEMEHEIKAALDRLKPPPSQKDLTLYLHSLFATRSADAEESAAAADAVPAIGAAPRAGTVADGTGSVSRPPAAKTGAEASGASWKWLIAALVIAALAGVGFLFLQARKADPPPPAAVAPPAPVEVPAPQPDLAAEPMATEAAAEVAAGDPAESTDDPEPEDPAAAPAAAEAPGLDLEQMVNEELTSRAERLRRKFEAEKKRIEEELARTQAASAAAAEATVASEADAEQDASEADAEQDASEADAGSGASETDAEQDADAGNSAGEADAEKGASEPDAGNGASENDAEKDASEADAEKGASGDSASDEEEGGGGLGRR